MLLPVYHLVVASFTTKDGLSLANYAQLFRVRRFQEAMRNSLLLGIASSVFGMLIGTLLAWLVARTNMPFRRLVRVCVLGSFAVPAFVNALSWVLLAGPNAGSLNQLWMALTGSREGFINIFSMQGLIVVAVATVYPLAFIFMHNAFETMDTEMEHAARLLGPTACGHSSRSPALARPAIIAGFIMTFLEALASLRAPAAIERPRASCRHNASMVVFEYPPQVGLAAALSSASRWSRLPCCGYSACSSGDGASDHSGKAGRWQRADLGPWRWVAASIAGLIVFVTSRSSQCRPRLPIVLPGELQGIFIDQFHPGSLQVRS